MALRDDLKDYIPLKVWQTLDNVDGDVVDAVRWNELFNLLITQGDDTTANLKNTLDMLYETVLDDTDGSLHVRFADAGFTAVEVHAALLELATRVSASNDRLTINEAAIALLISDLDALKIIVNNHLADMANPHNVTALQVGAYNIAQTDALLDDKANDSEVLHNTGNESVSGIKTFNSSPVVPEVPTQDGHAVSKKYADDTLGEAIMGSFPDNSIELIKNTPKARASIKNKVYTAVTTVSAIAITTDGTFEYADGNYVQMLADSDITAPATIAIDGGLAHTAKDKDGVNIDIEAGTIYLVFYNATDFTLAPRGASGVVPILGHTLTETGSETIDRTTPVQVVGSAYETQASARPIRLDNGWWVCGLEYSTTSADIMVSKDDGLTWNRLCYIDGSSSAGEGLALASLGTDITIITHGGGSGFVRGITIDALIQTDVNLQPDLIVIESGQTPVANGSLSLVIATNGDLHAAWSSKNATYPNSFNIRYSKSTDGGATWDAPTQITTVSITTKECQTPSIVIKNDGNPYIVYQYEDTSTHHRIYGLDFNGVSWTIPTSGYIGILIFDNLGYEQSNPSADVLSDGTIIVAWEGLDAIDVGHTNIRFSQSTDDGITWSAMEKITTGDVYSQNSPSITRNVSDEISIMWHGKTVVSSTNNIRLIQGTSLNWGVLQEILNDSNHNFNVSACNNYRNFEKPITIWMGLSEGNVKFYGKWEVTSYEQTLLTDKVKTGNLVYCSEDTVLELTLGGTQNIPSVNNAVNESELIATGAGELRTIGSVDTIYTGSVSKNSLGLVA